MSISYDQAETGDLVRLARNRDQAAWNEVVHRYAGLVWRVVAVFRLDSADAKDANQNTWFALAEHLARLRTPDRLPAWLATTARRECLRVLRSRRREVPLEWWLDEVEDPEPAWWPEVLVLRGARDRLLWRAFRTLPARCQRLLGLWAHAPELSYVQLGQA